MLSPFRGFRDFQSEIDRLMGETFGRWPRVAVRSEEWAPAIDVVTKDGDLVIKAELPGMKRDDVDITFHNGVLTVSGERKEEEETKEEGYLIRERRYGSFRRSMTLPEEVDEDKIKANFKEGLLEVTVEGGATRVEQQPRKIEIEGGA